jgi:hypothetical protein
MAWGLWNKIKNGFKKVGGFIKDKVLKPVVNTVIKPFKPVIQGVVSSINPTAGAIAGKVMDTVEKVGRLTSEKPKRTESEVVSVSNPTKRIRSETTIEAMYSILA